MSVLIPERGSCAGQTYPVDTTPYVLGRSPDCDLLDVFSDDSRVSRQHARLVKILKDLYVEDLGSVNGTFVNGQKIKTSVRLRDGDVLSICGIDLRYHGESPLVLSGDDVISSSMSLAEFSTSRVFIKCSMVRKR